MEIEQQKVSGLELEDGEVCPLCNCFAGGHNLEGCQNHPQCPNFYQYYDFEYLGDD